MIVVVDDVHRWTTLPHCENGSSRFVAWLFFIQQTQAGYNFAGAMFFYVLVLVEELIVFSIFQENFVKT